MKKLTAGAMEEIRLWMHRNARPLEMAIWSQRQEGGSRDAVLNELTLYQNEDGGFGNALEPDSWNPASTPYTTQYALSVLSRLGCAQSDRPMVQRALHFLTQTEHMSDFGWHFNIPTNNDYPHAPWWTYQGLPDEMESVGLTAELAAYLLRIAPPASPAYGLALRYADRLFDRLLTAEKFGDMGLGGYCALLETVLAMGLADRWDCTTLETHLRAHVNASIVRDPAKWVYYGVRPSNYIKGPDSKWLAGNEEILQAELDYLIDTRPADAVWGIPWSWFDLNERYAKAFAISENWWRGIKALETVELLGSFNRMEE